MFVKFALGTVHKPRSPCLAITDPPPLSWFYVVFRETPPQKTRHFLKWVLTGYGYVTKEHWLSLLFSILYERNTVEY